MGSFIREDPIPISFPSVYIFLLSFFFFTISFLQDCLCSIFAVVNLGQINPLLRAIFSLSTLWMFVWARINQKLLMKGRQQ